MGISKNSKDNLVKIRAIIVHEYWADPEDYDTSSPEEMCKIDAENWDNYPDITFERLFDKEDITRVIVEAPNHGVSFGPLTLKNS